uniref:NADH dehydrogenase subunit 6 n=1 Tax=Porphyridium aerugineum TaxID=2792 RepID=UPI001FCDF860|nr:NADH dehydrogenase subunit 6 [Porphyridium aerugineum]UNJ18814.1 NADH dehydrogenase subunit 6 [Porphyridium aerugineum]
MNFKPMFYIIRSFSLTSVCALFVVRSKNPVYSVLYLVLTFCNIANLLFRLQAEFFALLLLIVYAGAIAILFIFVVMMLNIKIQRVFFNWIDFWNTLIKLFFSISLSISLYFIELVQIFKSLNEYNFLHEWVFFNFSNIKTIGLIFYTKYWFIFLSLSLLLLISMVGSICLAFHKSQYIKQQTIGWQISRNFKTAVIFYAKF